MRVAIVGLGKLGAPMAAVTASHYHTVIGVDANPQVVAAINQRIAPVQETGLQELISSLPAGRLTATTDLGAAVRDSDVMIIMVPTPSRPDGSFDASLLVELTTIIARSVSHFTTVVIGSTVSPGTTSGVIKPALESTGLRVGEDVGLVYSPEFIALGSVIHDLHNPDMILVGADDPKSAQVYGEFVAGLSITHLTTVEAEIAKLSVNCYITTKISFANMIGEVCTAYHADPHTVLHAVGQDSRIGNKYFKSGGPYGGPCFPRDGQAMIQAAAAVNRKVHLMEATAQVNLDVITEIFLEAIHYKTIAILGMTYKTDTQVTEQSLGSRLLTMLTEWPSGRCQVYTHDPMLNGGDPQGFVRAVECVILATQWPEYRQLDYTGKHVIDPWKMLQK